MRPASEEYEDESSFEDEDEVEELAEAYNDSCPIIVDPTNDMEPIQPNSKCIVNFVEPILQGGIIRP